jgi:hypothetical protein
VKKILIWIDRGYRQWRDSFIFWQLYLFGNDRYFSLEQRKRFFWNKLNSNRYIVSSKSSSNPFFYAWEKRSLYKGNEL